MVKIARPMLGRIRLTGSIKIVFVTILLSISWMVAAQSEQVVNITDTITGNQEQPKVLYIVPWQPADDDSILYQPLSRQIGDTFAHVERSEHRRQMKFLEEIARGNQSAVDENETINGSKK